MILGILGTALFPPRRGSERAKQSETGPLDFAVVALISGLAMDGSGSIKLSGPKNSHDLNWELVKRWKLIKSVGSELQSMGPATLLKESMGPKSCLTGRWLLGERVMIQIGAG